MTHAFDPTPDRRVLLGVSLASLLALFVAISRETSPPWKATQQSAKAAVAARLGPEKAAALPAGLQQVRIEALSRVDRCVTCHVGIEGGAAFADLPGLARSHPRPELLAAHPVEKFGCTLCHGGRGPAVTKEEAHGDDEFCDDPLWSAERARRHGLTAAEMLESRCNVCHRADATTAGMPVMDAAKTLLKTANVEGKRCASCHRIDGRGGTAGPDLGTVGDIPAAQRSFPAGYRGPRTGLAWHAAHLRQPKSMVPTSEMKEFGFTEREAMSLALLVSSWKAPVLPPAWIPAPGRTPPK